MRVQLRAAASAVAFAACALIAPAPLPAADATTGTITGTVVDGGGAPIAGARVTAAAPSGRRAAATDARGRFMLLGLVPDSYAVSVEVAGYEPATQTGITVLPGQTQSGAFRLTKTLRTIGTVRAAASTFVPGAAGDTFTVTGATANASSPAASSSGLSGYTAGTVQGAIASAPGVTLDPFANAILRGGKIDDAVFSYDSVPVPQGLVANPGGNVVGAQLPALGLGATSVTLGGYDTQGDNALGGVVNQIPATGTYPASTTLELAAGVDVQHQRATVEHRGATPDLRWRYAFASTASNEYFAYGDGRTFYPSEAATYGLALQRRGTFAATGNVHLRPNASDDLSLLALAGESNYDQYGTPFSGERSGALNGATTVFPGYADPNAQVTTPSRVRGTYDIVKAQWLHAGAHSLARVQAYRSQFGSAAGGPYWDESGFPSGAISLAARQGGRESGIGYDADDVASTVHHLRYGAEYRVDVSFLDQVVPTADERIASRPTIRSSLVYLAETWSAAPGLDLTAVARYTHARITPSTGASFSAGAVDPHLAAVYRFGRRYALRATFDHVTVAPKPLEADRTDSTNVDAGGTPAPFVALAPERADDVAVTLEGGSTTRFRITAFDKREHDRIDVLPFNFRSAVAAGTDPGGVGIPTNVGSLRAHGEELWLGHGGFTFDANVLHASSSSASQFAYNKLNAPAIAAGHLFPIGYAPELSVTASYELAPAHSRVRLTPSLSYQTGYPYGNGRMVYVFDPVTHAPVRVPNDNHVNPGANYYFLRDPGRAFDAVTNPYVGDLGTPEGDDPNTLRSPPLTLVNLHAEADLSRRATVIVDVANVFGISTPSALQNNPYLIGPPGYAGGDPLYAAAYRAAGGYAKPYLLGNGVPTNDGVTQSVPWTYGRGAYVPGGYPLARTIRVRLRYRI